MKKLIYTFFATAALLFAAGCEREASPVDKEGYVDAEFNVTFAQPGTKADISDGTTATQLVVGVYDKDGNAYVPTLSWPVSADHANAFSGLQAKFTARLVKGHGYDIVFLAQAPDNGAYTIDLAAKTLTAKTTGVSNDEARDAFYGTYSVDKVDGAISENVILKRPFAQINVIDLKEDYEAAAAALVNFGGSSLKVTAPTVLNLLDGTVGTPAEYNFSKGTMSMVHPDFDPYKTNGDYWLLDNYILAGTASSTVNLEFSLYDSSLLTSYSVPNAPVQRNYRTNIYGSLLTSSGEFVVIIDPMYEGSNEFPIDGKTPEVTMQDSTLPAAGSTLNAEVNGTINLKAVHPIATIVPTYASSNTAVGTISADGVFTAVAPGTTVVTIKFPAVVNGVAVKSADNTYSSYTITYTVVVKGKTVDPAEAELAVTGTPTAAVEPGAKFNLTVATKSTAPVTVAVAPEGAATVADPAEGVYAVTAASNLSADTEVTVTFSQAAVDGFKAASVPVKFTVKKKAEDVPATVKNATVAEFLAAEVSSSQKYQLTGKIAQHKGSINTTYGNFDLVDATGTVYVYGLTKEEVALVIDGESFKGNNDKSFSQLGLEEGDTVTLIGYRSAYNDEIEVVGAYYVSHVKDTTPKFGATINGETIAAAGGTKTITVTGNVAWTASVTGGATLSATSGEGAGTITVTVPANTSETAEPEYVVKVSTTADVATKEYSFTIKQNKYVPSTGNETTVEFTAANAGGMSGENTVLNGQLEDVSIAISTGTVTAEQIRIFKNQTITISVPEGKVITKVVFTCTANGTAQYGPGCFTGEGYVAGSEKTGEWTGSAQSVTLTASSAQVRATSIAVTYK